jgi:F-type H+-transporting ATPase subunit delta
MRGTSRASLAGAVDRVEPLLGSADAQSLGSELFAVAHLLDGSAALRRALTDPNRPGQDKADLVGRLLSDKVSGVTMDVVQGLVRDRWSETRDLADACEHLAVVAVVADAERAGRLEAVEDELFRFGRLAAGTPTLLRALDDRDASTERKTELVRRLLEGKVTPQTLLLAEQAATAPRGRRFETTIEDFTKIAAERKERLIATVTSAVPLTEAHRQRLTGALTRIYGRAIHIDVQVDPEVIGGLNVQVGDEVIDATVLSRLEDARRRLAG